MEKINKTMPIFSRTLFFILLLNTLLFSGLNSLEKAIVKKGELNLFFSKNIHKKDIKHFKLTNPQREVYDFKNTRLAHKRVPLGLGNYVRMAQYKTNVVRVVIVASKGHKSIAYQPILSAKEYRISLPSGKGIRHKNYTKKTKKKKAHSPHKDELIVIDAGHGGHDSGASCGGKKEKHLALNIAKKVAASLKKKGYNVYLTRTSDRFLKLSQRTKIADKKNAVAFVSIHANSVPKRNRHKVQGVETYFLQNTRDARSQRIAARENALVLKGAGSKLSKNVIIDSVLSGPKIIESNKLAIDVQRRMVSNLRRKYKDVKDGGVRHAPFYVLVGASRPSVLVEVGYLSHPKERKRLFTKSYQDLIVKGISEGIDNYLINRRKEIDF